MNSKILTLSTFAFLALIVIAGAVSAVPICTGTLCSSVIDYPNTVSDGSDITITFNVTYEGTSDSFTVSFSTSAQPNIGTWKTLPADNTPIGVGETKEFSAVLNVPEHSNGVINAVIDVTSSTTSIDQIIIPAITINENPSFSISSSGTLSESSNASIILTNDGNVDLNLELSETSNFGVLLSGKSTINKLALVQGKESDAISVSLPENVNLEFGNNAVTIKAEDKNEAVSQTVSYTVKKGFCEAGEVGSNLEIRDVSVDNKGKGRDDEWQLLDNVEIEVDVKNTGRDNINDVFVTIGLFDSNGVDVVGDLDFEDKDEEEFDIGRVRDGDTETAKFIFNVPADFNDLGNYKLAVKAYSDDVGESALCVDSSRRLSNTLYESIDVIEDEDNVIAVDEKNIAVTPSEVTCGDNVFVNFDVYNVGNSGTEDQVLVTMKNSELNVDKEFVIRNNMDEGDRAAVEFAFPIPKDAIDKVYNLEFKTFYDYRDNSDSYREVSKDTWFAGVKVIGCSNLGAISGPGGAAGNVLINAQLDSDAVAGKKLVVKSTITNLGSDRMNFIVNPVNYESWATLDSVSNRLPSIGEGDSEEIVFTFTIDETADKKESFVIEVRASDGSVINTREVVVDNIETTGGSSGVTGLAGLNLGGDGALLWVIGIINVVLIILIIIVAVRISRR